MNDERTTRPVFCSSFILPRSSFSRSAVSARNGLSHHLFVDGDHPPLGRIELQAADDAAVRLAQGAGAEALLAGGVPGDGDERAARDLQVDAERGEVVARGAENRRVRLDEDAGQVTL